MKSKAKLMWRAVLAMSSALLFTQALQAQPIAPQTYSAANSGTVISGIYFDWTLGEMVLTETSSGPGVIITQGFHQPPDISLSAQEQSFTASFGVYPNPFSTQLIISYAVQTDDLLQVEITDSQGRLVMDAALSTVSQSSSTQLDVSMLSAGNYYLRIHSKNEMRVWNLVKVQ